MVGAVGVLGIVEVVGIYRRVNGGEGGRDWSWRSMRFRFKEVEVQSGPP